MAKAPELRHLIEFRFYAETYDKWWTDDQADFEAEQMRMVEEYSECFFYFYFEIVHFSEIQIQGRKGKRKRFNRWTLVSMIYALN